MSEIRVSGWSGSGEALFLVGAGVFTASSHGGRAEEASWGVSFIRALIPFMGSPLSRPHHLLKAPPLLTPSPWGLGCNMCILRGHQHTAQNTHKLHDCIYNKHPEQENPETGSG